MRSPNLLDECYIQILKLLKDQTISSSELARQLNKQQPTVYHELSILKKAGLVYQLKGTNARNQKYWKLRSEWLVYYLDFFLKKNAEIETIKEKIALELKNCKKRWGKK